MITCFILFVKKKQFWFEFLFYAGILGKDTNMSSIFDGKVVKQLGYYCLLCALKLYIADIIIVKIIKLFIIKFKNIKYLIFNFSC